MFLLIELGPAAESAVSDLIPIYSKLRKRKTVSVVTSGMVNGKPWIATYSERPICSQILEILATAGKNNPEALYTVIGALQDDEMTDTAVRLLVKRAKEDEKVLPQIIDELSSPDILARSGAAEALGLIGSKARKAIPRLKERVDQEKEPSREVRFTVAEALWKIDRQAYAIIPFRLEELQSQSEGVRWNAASFLGQYGAQSEPAIRALMELLKDPNNRVRGIGAIALGKIGPASKVAVPALSEALKDEYTNVQEAAAEALKKIQEAENAQVHTP